MPPIYCRPMSIKSDRWIRRMATERRMIEPFAENQARAGVISYGVSSYGYDMRVAPEFKIFTNALSAVVDPKRFDPKSFVEFTGDVCIVPPNSFALARSVEYFRIPRNVLTICVGKSTYARCGIITNVTPFEPEWEGFVTLEISNTTPLPAKIYANEGIAQVLFFTADEGAACEVSYADKKGKYQAQRGITLPRLEGRPDRGARPQHRDDDDGPSANDQIGHPAELGWWHRQLQEVHHEVEHADEQAEQHGGMESAPQARQDAAAEKGYGALARRDPQGGDEVLDQRAPKAGATRVIAEEPGVHERQCGPGDRGAHRRPQRIPDHDLHPVARVGHHDGQMWRPPPGPASRGVKVMPTVPPLARPAQ